MTKPRIAIVGDYEGVLDRSAHVDRLRDRADVTVWREPLDQDRAREALASFEILVALRERVPFPRDVLAGLSALEFISQSGGHAYHIDLEAATGQGILVAAGRGEPGGGKRASVMPELVFGMVFSLLRDIPRLHQQMAAGGWPPSLGRTVRGKTLGILGLGRHGGAVAQVAQVLGMRVVAWGPTLTPERAQAAGVELLDLDDLLAEVDVLSIHLKLSDQSRGLLDRARLASMRPGAILINTARGAIVDEDALVDALAEGHLGGAGLDVYTEEPLPPSSGLRARENVVLTPHVGWTVDRILEEFAEDTSIHVERYLDGTLRHGALLNPEALERDRERLGGVAPGTEG